GRLGGAGPAGRRGWRRPASVPWSDAGGSSYVGTRARGTDNARPAGPHAGAGRYGADDGRPRSDGSSEPTQQSRRTPLLFSAERRVPSTTKPARSATAREARLPTSARHSTRSTDIRVKAQRQTARVASVMWPRPR